MRLYCYVNIMRGRTSIALLIAYLSYIAFILTISSDRLHFLDIFGILRCVKDTSKIRCTFNMTSILCLELAIAFRTSCLRKPIRIALESSVLIGAIWVIRPIFLVLLLFCFKKLSLSLYNLNRFSCLLRRMTY